MDRRGSVPVERPVRREPVISFPWLDEEQTMVDLQRVKVNGELATDLLAERDRYKRALESIHANDDVGSPAWMTAREALMGA